MVDILAFPKVANARDPQTIAALNRRLSDKILIAFHQACEQQDQETARQLLAILDFMWERDQDAPWGRRGNINFLVPARERYQHLVYFCQPVKPPSR